MSEDVELCLEVQMDEASRQILANPHKCAGTLLDVTVVKPKELEAFGTKRTNTLRADQVRKLIASLEKQRREKQKIIESLKNDETTIKVRKHVSSDKLRKSKNNKLPTQSKNSLLHVVPLENDVERKDFIGIADSVKPLFCEIRKSLRNVETRITSMQEINLTISETVVENSSLEKFSQKPSKHLRNPAIYRVTTPSPDLKSILHCKNRNKVEGKCLCESCGTVGLLLECQKQPFMSDSSVSPGPTEYRKSTLRRRKNTKFSVGNAEEHRLNLDNTSYLRHLSKRLKLLEERLLLQEERVVSKDYFKKVIAKMARDLEMKSVKSKSRISLLNQDKNETNKRKTSNYGVKSMNHQNIEAFNCFETVPDNNVKQGIHKNYHKSTLTDENLYSSGFWRWGEEILRPGIDLKNRIITLVNEILSKFALSEEENDERNRFRKFLKQMNTKVFNSHMDAKNKFMAWSQDKSEHFETLFKQQNNNNSHERNEDASGEKKINVSYINPKLSFSKRATMMEGQSSAKEQFFKIIAKAKPHQKEMLWRNIWNQARANKQSREDKITIKIPKDKRGTELVEMELAIGELEEILNK